MKRYFAPIVWIALFLGVSALNGLITRENMDWYQSLNKSVLTPPDWMFPVAWSSLYVLMGLAAWRVVGLRDRRIIMLFALLTLFNWGWSALFFALHMTGLSSLSILIQVTLTGFIIANAWTKDRAIAYLLTPLILWTGLATYLNSYIWLYN